MKLEKLTVEKVVMTLHHEKHVHLWTQIKLHPKSGGSDRAISLLQTNVCKPPNHTQKNKKQTSRLLPVNFVMHFDVQKRDQTNVIANHSLHGRIVRTVAVPNIILNVDSNDAADEND